MKNFKFSSLIVSLAIFATTAQAGSQVYKYYLKARPAELEINGWRYGKYLGDHSYVCIKRKKYKHGKWKTVRNYGCHNVFGRNSGGSTRAVWYVKKTDKNSKLKDAAIKTQRVWQCSQGWYNHYGSPNTGLCHQATNRILYAVPYHPTVGSRVRGYYNGIGSYYIYGKYGAGWWACKRATYGKVDRNY